MPTPEDQYRRLPGLVRSYAFCEKLSASGQIKSGEGRRGCGGISKPQGKRGIPANGKGEAACGNVLEVHSTLSAPRIERGTDSSTESSMESGH